MDTTSHIRISTHSDVEALRRLGELDGLQLPAGEALVAEVGGDIVAAISLADGAVAADPFRRTAEVVAELQEARSWRQDRTLRPRPLAFWRRIADRRPATPRAAGAPAVPGSENLLIR